MKTCDFCGNPVNDNAITCPYCAHPLSILRKKTFVAKKVLILNIEAGKPFVKEALQKFDLALKSVSSQNIGIIKIIHGYGSSGTGGHIKIALRQHLKTLQINKIIKGFITGETYSKSSNTTIYNQKLIDCYPELAETLHADKYNPGITFVEL